MENWLCFCSFYLVISLFYSLTLMLIHELQSICILINNSLYFSANEFDMNVKILRFLNIQALTLSKWVECRTNECLFMLAICYELVGNIERSRGYLWRFLNFIYDHLIQWKTKSNHNKRTEHITGKINRLNKTNIIFLNYINVLGIFCTTSMEIWKDYFFENVTYHD